MNNNYYVYVHKIADTGEIFYIGKGRGSRLTSNYGRSIPWNEIVAENDWFAEKHTDDLLEDDAFALETSLIQQLKPRGNVQKKSTRARPVIKKDFAEFYYYCETSKSGLRFKKDGLSSSSKGRHLATDEAGTKLSTGYYSVSLNGKNYFAHRVVWALINGDIDKEIIDHKDKNRSNNKIENLRVVTSSVNGKNSSLKRHNKTGFIGVTFLKKHNIYTATWSTDEMKQERKHFSATKYGKDLALALAVEYRYRKTLELQTYTPDSEYKKLPALSSYSEEEITQMFDCDIMATNKSGVNGVHFAAVRGSDFWVYNISRSKTKRFSCTKHGNDTARKLAIEYKDFIENGKDFNDLSALLKDEILNPTNANNSSGIRGLSFTGVNKDIILAQCTSKRKTFAKTFDIKEYGLLPSISMAIEWRENIKKERISC